MTTLLRPHKTKQLIRTLIAFFGFVVVFGGFYIYEYAQFAEVRHEVESLAGLIVKAKENNAILKQEYYSLTDPSRLREIAEAEGLILERRPSYLTYYR